jgi:hypothetical protein
VLGIAYATKPLATLWLPKKKKQEKPHERYTAHPNTNEWQSLFATTLPSATYAVKAHSLAIHSQQTT